MNRKFKIVKNKHHYIDEISNRMKQWVKKNLTIWDLVFLISSVLFSTNFWVFLVKVTFAIILILFQIFNYYDDNSHYSIVAFNITGLIMFKFFPLEVSTSISKISYSRVIIFAISYVLVYLLLYIMLYFFVCLILKLWSSYLILLKALTKKKLKNKLPITKQELEDCGVHDRLDCLLYYHYMVRGFGLFKKAMVDFRESPIIENLSNFERIFYSFDLTDKSIAVIEDAVNNHIISRDMASTIYNQQHRYYYSYNYYHCFLELLESSHKLYLEQMAYLQKNHI